MDWKEEMANAIRTPDVLAQRLSITDPEQINWMQRSHAQFPICVTEIYLQKIECNNPNDPLLRQILPIAPELETHNDFQIDPVGDLNAIYGNGLIQKYAGRALLITTSACAIHCRYCFRRHFPYAQQHASTQNWEKTLAPIATDSTIHELILSGGDPLVLDDEKLENLLHTAKQISHLKTIRFHTRIPTVLPSRITEKFCNLLQEIQRKMHNDTQAKNQLKIVIVLHINHPNELDETASRAIEKIKKTGTTLLNQSVLLHKINDSIETLISLSEKLFETGVLPYYLHLLDRVQGAAHFEVPEEKAIALIEEIGAQLPGYLVPKLVREVAGEKRKIPVYSSAHS